MDYISTKGKLPLFQLHVFVWPRYIRDPHKPYHRYAAINISSQIKRKIISEYHGCIIMPAFSIASCLTTHTCGVIGIGEYYQMGIAFLHAPLYVHKNFNICNSDISRIVCNFILYSTHKYDHHSP